MRISDTLTISNSFFHYYCITIVITPLFYNRITYISLLTVFNNGNIPKRSSTIISDFVQSLATREMNIEIFENESCSCYLILFGQNQYLHEKWYQHYC